MRWGGWRVTSIGLPGGTQLQEKLVLGFTAQLPALVGGHVRAQLGLELAVLLLKHGGGLPSEAVSFASGRHYIDQVNFGSFVRFELARAL